MKLIVALTLMLLLSGCVVTGGSADAICAIPAPQLEASGLTEHNILELDLYAERVRAACAAI